MPKNLFQKFAFWLEESVAPAIYYCDRCGTQMERYYFKKEIRKGDIHLYCESCSEQMIKEMEKDEYRNV